MANLNVAIAIAARDNASGPIGRIRDALGGLRNVAGASAAITGGVLLTGLGATVAGLAGGAVAGLRFNNSMEKVEAQLNAFTKDGAKTAEILDMIRTRAAATPFAFEEMAQATTSLMPAAKASGQSLEALIGQAEILAASNPAQGLEGAAFALREALSGDFTSIIERFNLPRKYINELKEQGVPELQIVSQAMQQMGFDASLVSNLAQTASGRWSTFTDTLTNLAAIVTQPIFDTFSQGLGLVNDWLSTNQSTIEGYAQSIADLVGVFTGFFANIMGGEGALTSLVAAMLQLNIPIATIQTLLGWFNVLRETIGGLGASFDTGGLAGLGAQIASLLQGQWPTIQAALLSWGAQFWDWLTGPGGAIEQAGAKFGQMVDSLGAWVETNPAIFQDIGTKIGDIILGGIAVGEANNAVMGQIATNFGLALGEAFLSIGDMLQQIGTAAGQRIISGMLSSITGGDISNEMSKAIQGGAGGLVQAFNPLGTINQLGKLLQGQPAGGQTAQVVAGSDPALLNAVNNLNTSLQAVATRPVAVSVALDRAAISKAVSQDVAYNANGARKLGAAHGGL